MTGWLKVVLELGPLVVFFVVFTVLSPKGPTAEQLDQAAKYEQVQGSGVTAEDASAAAEAQAAAEAAKLEEQRLNAEIDALIGATIAFMLALFISLGATYYIDGTLSRVAIFTAVVVLITGALTVILRDGIFIKMKPTIAYGFFALGLWYGLWRKRSYLKDLMGELAQLTDKGWMVLARNWAIFFLICAVLNEYIWRFYSTEVWVWTKTFVYVPLIVLFTAAQIPVMTRYALEKEEDKSDDKTKVGA